MFQTWIPLPSWRGGKPSSLNFGGGGRMIPPEFLEGHKERSFPPQMPFPSPPKYCSIYWPSFTKIMIKVIQKKYFRKLSMCQRSWLKIAATQNLASYENDYLDVADHFWRGVEEGILPPPFSWGERWRGGERNFWRGVKKGVPSENSGGYPSLARSKMNMRR